ncbi:sugar ABC transporter substrate-binding protein [Fimbriimonas ginsengisoli Gsoil 348]|uniref:Sugar ABC transporter substrate-binding protein n=1 Tax=Fimbriimonas ginsengisoli Gsoil 348 TaxID=661478 RepID=A0A068NZ17_FIMGI|nr:sugar ABC transporter substrate-binding protein [Fimbriimonas ginsengisoli Gsoil 348]
MALVGTLVAIIAAPSPQLRKHPSRKAVRIWHMWSGEWKEVVDDIVAKYNASQDKYEVVPLSLPEGAETKLQMGIAGGDPPDAIVEWNPVIPTWAQAGLLQPMDELMTPAERAGYDRDAYPVVKRIGIYNDHIYGLAVGLNLSACYVRKDILKEAGVDPETWVPKTLEELEEVGHRMDRRDKNGNLTRIGFMPVGFNALAPAYGGGLYDWNGKQQVTIDTPENRTAMRHSAEARKRLGFDDVVRFQSSQGSDFGGAWSFIQGYYGILMDGQWRVEQLRKYAPDVPYRVFPLPPPKGGLPLAGSTGGNFILIPKGAKNVDGAWDFVKWWNGLDDPNTAADPFVKMAQMPPSRAVANTEIYRRYLKENPAFAVFVSMLPSRNIQPLPPVPYQLFLSDKRNAAEDAAQRGSISPDDSLKRLDQQVRAEIARRKSLGYPQ